MSITAVCISVLAYTTPTEKNYYDTTEAVAKMEEKLLVELQVKIDHLTKKVDDNDPFTLIKANTYMITSLSSTLKGK